MAEFTKSLFRGIMRGGNKEPPGTAASSQQQPRQQQEPEGASGGETEVEGEGSIDTEAATPVSSTPRLDGEASLGSEPTDASGVAPPAAAAAAAPSAGGELDEKSDSSEDEEEEVEVVKEGELTKWTNYISGWQERYIVLKGGFLSYFKDKQDTKSLCRGTIDVRQALVSKHEFDTARFDLTLHDQVFYFRCASGGTRQEWLEALAEVKARRESSRLSRRPSTLSLTSITSTASGTSAKARTFAEKLAELKTFRDLFNSQASTLVTQLGSVTTGSDKAAQRDALALKATTAALADVLGTCVDMMARREEDWERKYEKAQRRRRRAEQECKTAKESMTVRTPYGGPDYVEGPTSVLKEEEFFDALESGLDQLDTEAIREQELRRKENEAQSRVVVAVSSHRFTSFLEGIVGKNLELAQQNPQEDSEWQMALDDGEMKVYRREVVDRGITCDRLKAYHIVKGLTAKEMCMYFFDTKYRMEWEHTVEKFFVLERFGPDTLIFHNLHKRIWPSAQRDSCCLSHVQHLGSGRWMVQNISVEHDAAPSDKYVRVDANIMLLVSTTVDTPASGPLTRDHVACRITYMAYVNPGGWVPPAALRAVSQREYPRFLRTFSSQCIKHYADLPVEL